MRRWMDRRVLPLVNRELSSSDRLPVAVLGLAVILIVADGISSVTWLPSNAVIVPMIFASFWLSPRVVPRFLAFCLFALAVLYVARPETELKNIAVNLVSVVVCVTLWALAMRTNRLGVSGVRTESMFVDLRERIEKHGQLPQLPPDWQIDSAISAEGGTAFSGDFVVATQDRSTATADIAVVDVSGKGVSAGTRSLLLSGAFGGLLSALPSSGFLAAASDFVGRQEWDEDFATAIHLHLNTDTGEFEVRSAGHPPALRMNAGSGRWETLSSEGPALGLIDAPVYEAVTGVLKPGDALVLYTDGLVEKRDRDIGSGIDRLAGVGDRLIQVGFRNSAARVLSGLPPVNDDRAVVVVHRKG